MRGKSGFTLSEILVTLAVIGIIASITIPSLMQDIQDAQFKVAWKKAYADLSQATKLLVLDNSGSLKGVFNDSNAVKDKYMPYFNYTKTCNNAESFGNCWHKAGEWRFLNRVPISNYNYAGLILSNGNLMLLHQVSASCQDSGSGVERCGIARIDVNGFKGPNVMGRDIFNAHITETGIKPYGVQGDDFSPLTTCVEGSNSSNNYGWGCSAKYLYQ